jgi:hypothetical protein
MPHPISGPMRLPLSTRCGHKLWTAANPMGAEDACAYEALDRLLFRQWDPIGVSDMEGSADDEYRAYLPEF